MPAARLHICMIFLLFASVHKTQIDSTPLRMLPAGGLDLFSSGNTHGSCLRLSAGFEKGRNLLMAGPILQLSGSRLNGGRLTFSRNITAAPRRPRPDARGRYRFDYVQMNLMAFLQYLHNAPMSERAQQTEQRVARGPLRTFDQLRMSTAEAGAGIELRLNVTRHLCWFNSAAVALHSHLKYTKGISQEKTSTSLALCTGLIFVWYK